MQKMYQKNTMKVYHSHRKAMFSICEAGDMGEIFGINKETCGTSQLRQMGPRQTQVFWCFLHVWKWGTPRIPLETSARLRPWNACCWFEHSWNFKWPRMCGWNFWWMLGPARCFVWTYNRQTLESSCDLEPTCEPAWTVHVKSISNIPRFKMIPEIHRNAIHQGEILSDPPNRRFSSYKNPAGRFRWSTGCPQKNGV